LRGFAGEPYIFAQIKCADYKKAERTIHKYLEELRFSNGGLLTEWFLLSNETINQICDECR
jgi:hypothetical protein